jgi:molybdopterin synthase catalytic subunit
MGRLTCDPIDPAGLVDAVRHPTRGAVAAFVGTVRSPNNGKGVLHIEYSAYEPMAEQLLDAIEAELRGRYPEIALAAVHRLGRIGVGEASVAVAVAAPHRPEALQACADWIEQMKVRVPIWKKEFYSDGSAWIDNGECAGPDQPAPSPPRSENS